MQESRLEPASNSKVSALVLFKYYCGFARNRKAKHEGFRGVDGRKWHSMTKRDLFALERTPQMLAFYSSTIPQLRQLTQRHPNARLRLRSCDVI